MEKTLNGSETVRVFATDSELRVNVDGVTEFAITNAKEVEFDQQTLLKKLIDWQAKKDIADQHSMMDQICVLYEVARQLIEALAILSRATARESLSAQATRQLKEQFSKLEAQAAEVDAKTRQGVVRHRRRW